MKLLILFTFDKSLKLWNNLGILHREISLYQRLSGKGVKFKFLTYGDEQDLKFKPFLENIDIIPIKNLIKSKISIIKLIKSFLLPVRLKKEIIDVDIIKTNQVMGSWTAFLAKLLYKKKLIIRAGYPWFRNYISGVYFDIKKNYLKYLLNYCYIFLMEFVAYKLADFIILTNESDKEFIIKTFKLKNKKDNIKVISNFIDADLFKPMNVNKKDKHILRVGRLDKGKNLYKFFLAFRDLKGFKLDLIGNGPYETSLKDLANKQNISVNFVGTIPNEQLPSFINQYQIFVLPSCFEGNPKVLLEAMSCGVACIGTNVKGINNIIKHEKNGYLCETNSKSIAQAILNVYNNEELRERIGKNARDYILKNASLDSIAEKEYLIYKEVLGN